MSLIQKIRDKSAVLIFTLIVISMIAFILQDAFIGKTASLFTDDGSNIGVVGRVPISKEEFDIIYDRATQNYAQQQIPLSEEVRYDLLNNTFNTLVFEKAASIEEKKIGLDIPQKEFDEIFFGENIHPYIRQQFTDPKTGNYNEENVKSYLLQMKKLKNDNPDKISFLKHFVGPVLDAELNNKLRALFSKAVYLPSWMKNKQKQDASLLSKARVLQIPYNSLPDSAYAVSNKEIIGYVKKNNPELLLKENAKKIQVVSFEILPSVADSLFVISKLQALKVKLREAKDLKKALLLNGANKEYLNNYLRLSDFTEVEKKQIASLKNNEVYGPILQDGKWILYALLNKKEIPDSTKVRHILIGTNGDVKRSDSLAKKLADSMVYYLNHGASFGFLVNKYSDDQGSKASKGEYTFAYNQYGQLVKEFADVAFFGKQGDKKVIKTPFGYHYIENLQQIKPQAAYQLGKIVKDIDAGKATIDSVNQLAVDFIAQVNNPEQFTSQATKQRLKINSFTVKEGDNQSSNGLFIRPIVRWAFDNNKNTVSNIIPIENKFYVVTIQDEFSKGDVSTNDLPYSITNKILNEKKAKAILEANDVQKPKTIEAIAEKNKVSVATVDSLKLSQLLLSNFGFEPNVVARAFYKEGKHQLGTVNGNSGVYYIVVEDIYPNNMPMAVNEDLTKRYQEQINNEIPSLLKKEYKVKDLRTKFY